MLCKTKADLPSVLYNPILYRAYQANKNNNNFEKSSGKAVWLHTNKNLKTQIKWLLNPDIQNTTFGIY